MNQENSSLVLPVGPKCADLQIDQAHEGRCVVYHPEAGTYFRIGEVEADFLRSLDGSRAADQLRNDSAPLSPEQVDILLNWFAENSLLQGSTVFAVQTRSWVWRLVSGDMSRVKIHIWNPERFLERNIGAVHAFFGRRAMFMYLAVLLMPMITIGLFPDLLAKAWHAFAFNPSFWGGTALAVLVFATFIIHEMAHAISCKHYGGPVNSVGFMLMYLIPAFYCDISSSWRLVGKNPKLVVTAAGIFAQLLLSSVALTVWIFSAESLVLDYAIVNSFALIMNLVPLTKLDGYWMLAHSVDEPNLRARALEAVDQRLRTLLFGKSSPAGQPQSMLLLFGIAVCVATPLTWLLGITGINRYLSYLSTTLAQVGTFLIVARLIYQYYKPVLAYMRSFRASEQPRAL